jgi:hypothetical protein
MDARDAAIALIKAYVLRGDSYESLKESLLSSYNRDYRAGIGWSGSSTECLPKNADCITVSWLNGETVCQHFSLKQLYEEIKHGIERPRLF